MRKPKKRGTDLSVLRERPFLLLFSARSVSLLGDAMAPVGLAFAVLGMPGGSGSTLGLVLAAHLAAQAVFLLYGGVLADRLPRNRVMVCADLVAGAAQGLIALLVLTGSASTAALVALSAVSGAASALFTPASRSVTVLLVPPDKVQPANALVQLSMSVGSMSGAAVAGVLVSFVGPGWALVADAATFLVSAALLSGLRLPPVVPEPAGDRPAGGSRIISEMRGGWREFTARQWVWASVGQLALVNVCMAGGFLVLGPVIAARHLGGASAWAAVLACQAVGFAVGCVIGIRIRPRRPVRAAALFTLGIAPPFLCLAGTAPAVATAAAMFGAGLCIALSGITFETALQKHVPPEAMSRVMSYDAFGSIVFVPIGLAVVTPIADLAGTGSTLLGGASLVVLAALTLAALPSVGGVRDAGPDAGAEDDGAAVPLVGPVPVAEEA